MAGIIERIGSLGGTEAAKAINLAHATYVDGMGRHGHTGRAIVESVAAVCRNHPNIVGIGAGLLVEQLLVEEKRRHDAHVAADPLTGGAPGPAAIEAPGLAVAPLQAEHHLDFPRLPPVHLSKLRPGRAALEVFGALFVLKLGAAGAGLFRRKSQGEIWFAPAARIHMLSAALATYYFVKSLASPKVSAWRNAAVALFATDAVKPILKHRPGTPTLAASQPLPTS